MRPRLIAPFLLLAACAPAPSAAPTPIPTPSASMMAEASEAERVVQAQLEAYNRHDLDAFLATYAPDVKMYQHPDTLATSGVEQARQTYGDLFTRYPQVNARVATRIVQGSYVIDHEVVTGIAPGQELRAVAIYEVRNGKIQNVWFLQ